MRRAAYFLGALAILGATIAVPRAAEQAPASVATPTFAKDVAPIVYANCVNCHRPGEIAPMSLISYEDARPWAKAMKTKVVAREMPPWGADPQFGQFKDDRNLSQAQIDTIVRWVDGGAPKGNDADMPALPKFVDGWVHGEPDAVIEMPFAAELPAEGEMPTTTFYTPSNFKEDVFVKALEVRPGVKGVVHHAAINVVEKLPAGAKWDNGKIVDENGKSVSATALNLANGGNGLSELQKLLSFVPGRGYESYQDGAGQRIKAGSYIAFNMHYQLNGEPHLDRTKIGLYFAKPGEQVTHQIYHQLESAGPITYIVEGQEYNSKETPESDIDDDEQSKPLPNIPPYVDNFKVVSVHAIVEPITIYGLVPHLHLRGKSMKYTLVNPDGKEEVMLSVPKYDFNWQIFYELKTPKHVQAGSKIVVTSYFDNSLKNKYNPAPEKEVFWSEQSWDEMYSPQIRMTIDSRDLSKDAKTQQQQ